MTRHVDDEEWKRRNREATKRLDELITDVVMNDGDTSEGSIIIGWAVAFAYRTPEMLANDSNGVVAGWYVMPGQPPYASSGLLRAAANDLDETDEEPPT